MKKNNITDMSTCMLFCVLSLLMLQFPISAFGPLMSASSGQPDRRQAALVLPPVLFEGPNHASQPQKRKIQTDWLDRNTLGKPRTPIKHHKTIVFQHHLNITENEKIWKFVVSFQEEARGCLSADPCLIQRLLQDVHHMLPVQNTGVR